MTELSGKSMPAASSGQLDPAWAWGRYPSNQQPWNAALAVVVLAAGGLLAMGHIIAAGGAIAFGAVAIFARWSAMRKQGRGFYGQDKGTR